MDHNDHVNLLKPAKLPNGGIWADLGAGSGAFTLALRELIGSSGVIYAVDKDRSRLKELEQGYRLRFGESKNLNLILDDFSDPLKLPALDGLVMANSLHYFKDKEKILRIVRTYIKQNGKLLLVEYNVDKGNPWVPYPLSFDSWRILAPRAGFDEPRLLGKHPSSFLKEFYSAVVNKTGEK